MPGFLLSIDSMSEVGEQLLWDYVDSFDLDIFTPGIDDMPDDIDFIPFTPLAPLISVELGAGAPDHSLGKSNPS